MVVPSGIEPELRESKSPVQPLHHGTICGNAPGLEALCAKRRGNRAPLLLRTDKTKESRSTSAHRSTQDSGPLKTLLEKSDARMQAHGMMLKIVHERPGHEPRISRRKRRDHIIQNSRVVCHARNALRENFWRRAEHPWICDDKKTLCSLKPGGADRFAAPFHHNRPHKACKDESGNI